MKEKLTECLHLLREERAASQAPTTMLAQLQHAFSHITEQKLQTALEQEEGESITALCVVLDELSKLINNTCLAPTANIQSMSIQALLTAAEYVAEKINARACPVLFVDRSPQDVHAIDLGASNSGLMYVRRETSHGLVYQATRPTTPEALAGFTVGYVRVKSDTLNELYYVNRVEGLCRILIVRSTELDEFDAKTRTDTTGLLSPESLVFVESQRWHINLSSLFYINKQRKELIALSPTRVQLAELNERTDLSFEELKTYYEGASLFNPLGLLIPSAVLPTDEGLSLERRLRKNILGCDGLYLVPVSVLLSEEMNLSSPLIRLTNPAYDESLGEERAFLNQDELTRLETHAVETETLFQTKRQYHSLIGDDSNLLGQLERLNALLELNAAHGGRGVDENAAGGAYPAIIDFMTYYQGLSDEQRAQLPAGVRGEIEMLLDFASNPSSNRNATETIGTCIATRRVHLRAAVTGNEGLLSRISMGAENKETLVNQALADFSAAKEALKGALDRHEYLGHDHLGLTLTLMDSLGVQWTISSSEELKLLTQLSVEDMKRMLERLTLKRQIIAHLGRLENLVIMIMETPAEKVKVFLESMGSELSQRYLGTATDLAALLISLEVDKIQATLQGLANIEGELARLVASADDVNSILRHLSPEQCGLVLIAIEDRLLVLIRTAQDVNSILRHLSPEQCGLVLSAIEDRLPVLITTAQDVNLVLWNLSPEQRTLVFTAIEDRLPVLITTADDINRVLRYLSPEQRMLVLNAIQERLPVLIRRARDVVLTLRDLSPEQCALVLTAIQDRLLELITTAQDVANVLMYLSPEQCGLVLTAIQDRLLEHIRTAQDVNSILRYLSPEQCALVLTAIEDRLPVLCTRAEDVVNVLRGLTFEQCIIVESAIGSARLMEIIQAEGQPMEEELMQLLSPQMRWELTDMMAQARQEEMNHDEVDEDLLRPGGGFFS